MIVVIFTQHISRTCSVTEVNQDDFIQLCISVETNA